MSHNTVQKINSIYDEADDVWFDLYAAPGLSGPTITALVPREDQSAGAVRRHLLRHGAQLPPAEESRAELEAAIATQAAVIKHAARTGWRDDNRLFVTHTHVVGTSSDGIDVEPSREIKIAVATLAAKGTLEDWLRTVRVAKYSTSMTVTLCAVFAAPLLHLLNRPSFALVLVGPSRCGKSTAQLVAASSIGFGREESLPTLNATHAGLIAAASAHNDQIFIINEVGTARGSKREAYNVLREATYSLVSGHDVLRHPSWSGASAGEKTFKLLAILSSEYSPDTWAARNGEARDDGEKARLIGLPVLARGRRTIFDRTPKGLAKGQRKEWRARQFHLLRKRLPLHRGTAFPAYVEALTRDPQAAARQAAEVVAAFEAWVGQPTMSAVARDIVSKFGVLAAGGLAAIDAGILPLKRKEVLAAVRRACLAALSELPDVQAELRADLRMLHDRLAGPTILDLDTCSAKEQRLMRNADGFGRRRQNDVEFIVRSQVFTGWFLSLLRCRQVLLWLDDEGFLDHGRKRTDGRSVEWAQKQLGWPDETRKRSIKIYLPNGMSDLKDFFS